MLAPQKAAAPREPNYLDLKRIAEVDHRAADLDFALQRCCTTPTSKTARETIRAQVRTVLSEMLKS